MSNMISSSRRFGFLVATALLSAGAAHAECGAGTSAADVKACLAQELRDSDQRINATYKAIMAAKDETGKTSLRDAQRTWLKSRDKACNLDNKESDREKWLQAILADQKKTVCVVRYTFARVGELNAMMTQAGASTADLPPAPQAPDLGNSTASADGAKWLAALTPVDDGYQVGTNASHNRGKWYYEITVDSGKISALGDLLLSSGIVSDGPSAGVVQMTNIRHGHTEAPSTSLGWAIDLDNGVVYTRQDGTWLNQPGTTGAPTVTLNSAFRGYLEGSSAIAELIKRGLIKVNLGQVPFAYAMPDGYRPFAEQ
jgi:uncharacterized protein YecT (DUF1311 family)